MSTGYLKARKFMLLEALMRSAIATKGVADTSCGKEA
jgi:hypothetical protein